MTVVSLHNITCKVVRVRDLFQGFIWKYFSSTRFFAPQWCSVPKSFHHIPKPIHSNIGVCRPPANNNIIVEEDYGLYIHLIISNKHLLCCVYVVYSFFQNTRQRPQPLFCIQQLGAIIILLCQILPYNIRLYNFISLLLLAHVFISLIGKAVYIVYTAYNAPVVMATGEL